MSKMRELLLGTGLPAYLDETGRSLLDQSRTTAAESGVGTRVTLPLGPRRSCLLTWGGTRVHTTLSAMMMTLDVHPIDRLVGLDLPMPEDQVPAFVKALLGQPYNAEHLALAVQDSLPRSKFDWILGPELVAIRHARQFIDVSAARLVLEQTLLG